ncbi:hypothetical protein [Streptomyces sp. NPDC056255]
MTCQGRASPLHARAQETAQHVLMREATMKTSGPAERLRGAQDALRESVG